MGTLERLPALLYRRFGVGGIFAACAVGSWIVTAIIIVAVCVSFISYSGLSFAETRGFFALAQVAGLVGVLIAVSVTNRSVRTILSWSGDRRIAERAPEVWRAAVTGPRAVVTAAVIAIALLQIVPISLAVANFDEPAYVAVLMAVLALATTAAAGIFVIFAIEFALRPMTEDVAGLLPSRHTPEVRTLSLWAKAVIPIPGSILFTGFFVGAFVDTTSGPGPRLASALGLAAATIAPGIALFILAMRSALGPIDTLTEAARQVGKGDLTQRVAVISADELGALARSFNEMVAGLRQREVLHAAMGAYVDLTIADRILDEGHMLRGEAVHVTIMFIDIVSFTASAERTAPEDVVARLNEFFGIVIPAIEACGGHPNKLLGDGAMAVFGIPAPLSDHADRALAAARSIDEQIRECYGDQLRVGIGLNSGVVVAGSMGGGGKLDYTVVGDAVNVASRVEALTRTTGDTILLTEATRASLSATPDDLRSRGSTPVKGRNQQVVVYTVASRDGAD